MVRLNCNGTLRDLQRLGIQFYDGMPVLLHDGEDNLTDGTVTWESGEGWVAKIDWDCIRPWTP